MRALGKPEAGHFRLRMGRKPEEPPQLLVQVWPQLQKLPEFDSLLTGLSAEEVKRARDGIKLLNEPARKRRSFRRDTDAQIQGAVAKCVKPKAK